jgi:hypothetical protein
MDTHPFFYGTLDPIYQTCQKRGIGCIMMITILTFGHEFGHTIKACGGKMPKSGTES